MPSKIIAVTVLLLGVVVRPVGAQTSGTTRLALQITPEAHLDPRQLALNFRVSASGDSDVTSQTARVTAWVRALPGHRIRVVARLIALSGPDGQVPVTEVRWTGSTARATGGGQVATCSNGAFEPGVFQDLVVGWQRSGILTCAVKFELTAPRKLSPGLYSGTVDVALDPY